MVSLSPLTQGVGAVVGLLCCLDLTPGPLRSLSPLRKRWLLRLRRRQARMTRMGWARSLCQRLQMDLEALGAQGPVTDGSG